jgi:nucleotide-binding universal stress UspA family protein
MKVLLAIDGSDASMSAVAATAALPMPDGTTVEIVSVVPDSFAPEGSVWPNVIRVDPPTDRDRVLDDVARRLLDVGGRIRVGDRTIQGRVLEGRPATEIVAEATRFGADLIVIGARGLSTVRRLLVGSVSSEVVDHAPCPVLVARHAAVGRVLWATDGSRDADRVGEFFSETGLFEEAEVRVVTVPDPGIPWWTGITPVDGATSIEFYADSVDLAAKRALATADAAAERLGIRNVTAAVAGTHGDVAGAILAEAEACHADIVAVGARSLGTVRRWLIGSVSRAVLHHAPMSVLIVRPRVSAAPEREEEAAIAV